MAGDLDGGARSRDVGGLAGMNMTFRRALGLIGHAALLFLALLATPATAQKQQVDLQLILAVDASGSVNQTRFELQKQGYAAAFRTHQVLNAIRSGPSQSIAVTMVQWTGYRMQVHVVPMPTAPYQGLRQVIDISGDGANNTGRPVTMARDEAVRAGIVINGLPIVSIEPYLDRYYFDNVIGGPGAFMVGADSYETFAGAIQRKLVLEIAMDLGRQYAAADPDAE
jgi:hypothetical protein